MKWEEVETLRDTLLTFDKSKRKNISMKWEEVETLRETLLTLVPHVQQMEAEMVSDQF